jgi:hypothetical protein
VNLGKRLFNGFTSIRSFDVPETVTGIATRCFESCTSLESITLPDGLLSISPDAFTSCVKLREITIPYKTAVSSTAFQKCNLEKIICYASSAAAGATFVKTSGVNHPKDIICYLDDNKVYCQSQNNITGAVVYLAGYDANDNLLVAEKLDVGSMTAGTVYEKTSAKVNQLKNCDHIKVMLWYGDNNTPVCRVAIY